jgi:hypothetical protein
VTIAETFIRDQAEAAHEEALRCMLQAGTGLGFRHGFNAPTPWLQRLIDGTLNAPAKRRRTCPHVRGSAPRVTFLAAHDRVIRCAPCAARLIAKTRASLENFTCDRCRLLTTPDRFLAAMFVVGTTLVSTGACRDCAPDVIGADR